MQQSKKLSRDGNGTLHTRHNEQLKSKIHRNPHYITTLKLRMTPQWIYSFPGNKSKVNITKMKTEITIQNQTSGNKMLYIPSWFGIISMVSILSQK